jgi:hypothetical protein
MVENQGFEVWPFPISLTPNHIPASTDYTIVPKIFNPLNAIIPIKQGSLIGDTKRPENLPKLDPQRNFDGFDPHRPYQPFL